MLAVEEVADAPLKPGIFSVFQLAPRQVLPDGVPVYDWNDLTKLVELKVPDFKGGDGGRKGRIPILPRRFPLRRCGLGHLGATGSA